MSRGPTVRTDIVEAFIFRRAVSGPAFLQLLRAKAPQQEVWHPVLGHIESGESALEACLREVFEETGLKVPGPDAINVWQLEQVHPFFLVREDSIVLSPRFVIEVRAVWSPSLNHENRDSRWVGLSDIEKTFVWPGQRAACREAAEEVIVSCRYAPIRLDR